MAKALLFSLTAAFNPTLFAAVLVMLASKNAERLMLGYFLGALLTSVATGLVIVFALPESSATTTSKNTLSPALDLTLGALAIIAAIVLASGEFARVGDWRQKRQEKKADTGPPRWRRALDRGSPRIAFVVGIALSLPGASYLVVLDVLHKQDLSVPATTLAVIVTSLISLLILELPLLGFAVAREQTVAGIARFQAWISRDARAIAFWVALLVGLFLIARGLIELLT